MADPAFKTDENGNIISVADPPSDSNQIDGKIDSGQPTDKGQVASAQPEPQSLSPIEFLFLSSNDALQEEADRSSNTLNEIEADLNNTTPDQLSPSSDRYSTVNIGGNEFIDIEATLRHLTNNQYPINIDPGSRADQQALSQAVKSKDPEEISSTALNKKKALVFPQLKNIAAFVTNSLETFHANKLLAAHQLYVKLPDDSDGKNSRLAAILKNTAIIGVQSSDIHTDAKMLNGFERQVAEKNYVLIECRTPLKKGELRNDLINAGIPAGDMEIDLLSEEAFGNNLLELANKQIAYEDLITILHGQSSNIRWAMDSLIPAAKETWKEFSNRFDTSNPSEVIYDPAGDVMDWAFGMALLTTLTYGVYMAEEHPQAFQFKIIPKIELVDGILTYSKTAKLLDDKSTSSSNEVVEYRNTLEVDLAFLLKSIRANVLAPFKGMNSKAEDLLKIFFEQLNMKGMITLNIDSDRNGKMKLSDIKVDFTTSNQVKLTKDSSLNIKLSQTEAGASSPSGAKFNDVLKIFDYAQAYYKANQPVENVKKDGKLVQPVTTKNIVRDEAAVDLALNGFVDLAIGAKAGLEINKEDFNKQKPVPLSPFAEATVGAKYSTDNPKNELNWSVSLASQVDLISGTVKTAEAQIRLIRENLSGGISAKTRPVEQPDKSLAKVDTFGIDASYRFNELNVKAFADINLMNGRFNSYNIGAGLQFNLGKQNSLNLNVGQTQFSTGRPDTTAQFSADYKLP